jgi:DNA-binding GntR family transcriptional regulator
VSTAALSGNGRGLSSIHQPSLAQRAYEQLKEAILSGTLAPGAPLAEVELGEAMGISRTPVREALALLRRDGLVDAVPGGGNVVHALTDQEVRELFLVREALESLSVKEFVAGPAARRRSSVELLQAIVHEQRDAMKRADVAAFLDADERFHLTICEEAGLPQAGQMLVTLRDKMRQAGLGAVAHPQRMPVVLREHQAIVDALRSGPRTKAAAALGRHLAATREAIDHSTR